MASNTTASGRARCVRAKRDERRQLGTRARVDTAAQTLRPGEEALGLGRGAVGALDDLLDEACAFLCIDAHVLTRVELRLDVALPGCDLVPPGNDPESVFADAIDGEVALPPVVPDRCHPCRAPAPFLLAPVLETHRELAVAVRKDVRLDDHAVLDDAFGRESARVDVRSDVLDRYCFGIVRHPRSISSRRSGVPASLAAYAINSAGRGAL